MARRRRVWGAAVISVAGGAALYLTLAYQVLQAGGFTTTSVRSSCAEAATGRPSAGYRAAEDVDVDQAFLPLVATCRWSGGSSAELASFGWLSFVGPVLVLVGVVVLVGLQLSGRRR